MAISVLNFCGAGDDEDREMATASTGACNQCESVSAAPGSDSCEAGAAKKTVVALYAGTGKLSSQALVLEAIKHCFTPTILVT